MINKGLRRLLAICLSILLTVSCTGAWAQGVDSGAEWTVMIYLCGTDLESEGSSATKNLIEMAMTKPNDQVNVVIQTGGTREWHTSDAFEDWHIASDKLERYHYDAQGFSLDEQLPLANMASAETLIDFIRWGTVNYPAKKTALLLWDHGGGSYGGIISDELHKGSIMSIEDLGRALKTAGTQLEAMIFDACLMASLEVAQRVAPSAKYLIASEETVPDSGSNFTGWLQYLYDNPTCNGGELGAAFCDAIVEKYADSFACSQTLTFSTIDLSKLDAVSEAFDAFILELSATLKTPRDFRNFVYDTRLAQNYEMPQMVDLADMASRVKGDSVSREVADALVKAVDAAVVYEVEGDARSYSNGLSFFYAPQLEVNRLDHYARCCQSAAYLAFLDAASIGWTAPEWVYEQTERLEDIKLEDYLIELETTINQNGLPALKIAKASGAVAGVNAQLYIMTDDGDAVLLGTDVTVSADFETDTFIYYFPGQWLSLGGEYCPLAVKNELETHTLYRIPFAFANQIVDSSLTGNAYELRAALVYDQTISEMAKTATEQGVYASIEGDYELYGVWNNIGTSNALPGRDVLDMSSVEGSEIVFLYDTIQPLSGELGFKELSNTVTLKSKGSDLALKPLPPGNYGFAYIVEDVFGSQYRSAPVKIVWDGDNVNYSIME